MENTQLVLVVLWALVGGTRAVPAREVRTTQGIVRGYMEGHPPTEYYAYRAIPYARVTHRFKAPKAARHWDGAFEATYQVECPQPGGAGVEDCLVVNVFSPRRADNQPVLVLVHDGDFQSGRGALAPPARLLALDVVIATFNHRLGALGFLCLGTPDAPGNVGLKDQVSLLYWIHKNIANFGGNPSDVTVYGIGSGATSTELILLSGVARGLFHKAILESGSALSPLSVYNDPIAIAFDAASAMGYTGEENAGDLARFYKQVDLKKLVNSSTLFLPCVETKLYETHSLLDSDPIELFQQKNYQAVPLIIAYTDLLGTLKTSKIIDDNLASNIENLLPNNLEFPNDNTKFRVAEIVRDFYSIDGDGKQNYLEYLNDVTNEYPMIKSAVLHAASSSSPTYLMKLSPMHKDQRGTSRETKYCERILKYFYEYNWDEEDQVTVERLVSLWSNFITIGDPTPLTSSLVPAVWPPVRALPNAFNIKSVTGLILGQTPQMSNQLAHNRILFWDQIYKKFYKLNSVSEDLIIV